MFIEILFKILLFKGGVLIYAEHCILHLLMHLLNFKINKQPLELLDFIYLYSIIIFTPLEFGLFSILMVFLPKAPVQFLIQVTATDAL